MNTTTSLAVAVLVLAAASTRCAHVEASIESTCQAAATADKRVSYRFCTEQFGRHHNAPDADTWGLAKVATLIGVNFADDAVYDIGQAKAGPRTKPALEQCAKLYDALGMAFARAADALTNRQWAPAKLQLAQVAPLTQQCESAFAKAGVRSPVAAWSGNAQQIAVIATVITNLIK